MLINKAYGDKKQLLAGNQVQNEPVEQQITTDLAVVNPISAVEITPIESIGSKVINPISNEIALKNFAKGIAAQSNSIDLVKSTDRPLIQAKLEKITEHIINSYVNQDLSKVAEEDLDRVKSNIEILKQEPKVQVHLMESAVTNAYCDPVNRVLYVNIGLLQSILNKTDEDHHNWDTATHIICHELSHILYENDPFIPEDIKKDKDSDHLMEYYCDQVALELMDAAGFNVRFADFSFFSESRPEVEVIDYGNIRLNVTHPNTISRRNELKKLVNSRLWEHYNQKSLNPFTEEELDEIKVPTKLASIINPADRDREEVASSIEVVILNCVDKLKFKDSKGEIGFAEDVNARNFERLTPKDQLDDQIKDILSQAKISLATKQILLDAFTSFHNYELNQDKAHRNHFYNGDFTMADINTAVQELPSFVLFNPNQLEGSLVYKQSVDPHLRYSIWTRLQENLYREIIHAVANQVNSDDYDKADNDLFIDTLEALAYTFEYQNIDYFNLWENSIDPIAKRCLELIDSDDTENLRIKFLLQKTNSQVRELMFKNHPDLKSKLLDTSYVGFCFDRGLAKKSLSAPEIIKVIDKVQPKEIFLWLRVLNDRLASHNRRYRRNTAFAEITDEVLEEAKYTLQEIPRLYKKISSEVDLLGEKDYLGEHKESPRMLALKKLAYTYNYSIILLNGGFKPENYYTSFNIFPGYLLDEDYHMDLNQNQHQSLATVDLKEITELIKLCNKFNETNDTGTYVDPSIKGELISQYAKKSREHLIPPELTEEEKSALNPGERQRRSFARIDAKNGFRIANSRTNPRIEKFDILNNFTGTFKIDDNKPLGSKALMHNLSEEEEKFFIKYGRELDQQLCLTRLIERLAYEKRFDDKALTELNLLINDHIKMTIRSESSNDNKAKLSETLYSIKDKSSSSFYLQDYLIFRFFQENDFAEHMTTKSVSEQIQWFSEKMPKATVFRDFLLNKLFKDNFDGLEQEQKLQVIKLFYTEERAYPLQDKYYEEYKFDNAENIIDAAKFIDKVFPRASEDRDARLEEVLSTMSFSLEEYKKFTSYYSANSVEYKKDKSLASAITDMVMRGEADDKVLALLWLQGKAQIPAWVTRRIGANLDELKDFMKIKAFREELLTKVFAGQNGLLEPKNKEALNNAIFKSFDKQLNDQAGDSQEIKDLKTFARSAMDSIFGLDNKYKKLTIVLNLFDKLYTQPNLCVEEFVATVLASYGIVGIKLGQILASQAEIQTKYPKLFSLLTELTDNANPMTFAEAMRAISSSPQLRDKQIRNIRRVGSASIKGVFSAEIYDSYTQTWNKKIIKVLRASANKDLAQEEKDFNDLFNGLQGPLGTIFGIKNIPNYSERIFSTIKEEIDFNIEKQNMNKLREVVSSDDNRSYEYTTPSLDEELSNGTVIVENLADGISLGEWLDTASESEHKQVWAALQKTFITQFFKFGFYHADPHPGNIFISKNKNGKYKITFIDTGLCGSIETKQEKKFLLDLVKSFRLKLNTAKQKAKAKDLYISIMRSMLGSDLKAPDLTKSAEKILENENKVRPLVLMNELDKVPDYMTPDSLSRTLLALSKTPYISEFHWKNISKYLTLIKYKLPKYSYSKVSDA